MRYFPSLIVAMLPISVFCQGTSPPYHESFDTLETPALPVGWTTTARRVPGGDFVSTPGVSRSAPNSLLSVNATVEQSISTQLLDLSDTRKAVLSWAERRSASHDASLIVEASTDGGLSFVPVSGDTLRANGTTGFFMRTVQIGDRFDEMQNVVVRWKVAGDGSGQTGTIRFDDVSLEGLARFDVAVEAAGVGTPRPRTGEQVDLFCSIVNRGFEAVTGTTLDVYTDFDNDGVPGAGELHSSFSAGDLLPGDSAGFSMTFIPDGATSGVIFIAELDGDHNRNNDTVRLSVQSGPAPGAIVINEIMYDPDPGRAEYIELFNRSGSGLDMARWSLTDRADDTLRGTLPAGRLILPHGGYMIYSNDSSLPAEPYGIPAGTTIVIRKGGISLNNNGDDIILRDATGFVIDRVSYAPEWHTPVLEQPGGVSLERIDPGSTGLEDWNWGSSADRSGGTPGRANSLTGGRAATGAELFCSPDPFSPDGDGFEDVTHIQYRQPGRSALIRVRIYNTDGWLVRTLTDGTYVPGEGAFVWNGFDGKGRKVQVGVYIVVLEGVDGSGAEVFTVKGVVTVAARL